MGCDIHGWVESKVNGNWMAVKELKDRSRDYKRFAMLAGVRGDGPLAKGIPKDCSDTVLHWSDGANFHSGSWYELEDAARIFAQSDGHEEPLDLTFCIYKYFGIWVAEPESRLVFWFDS